MGAAPDHEELAPDQAPPADLPKHARERLAEMRQKNFFTSDLSVNEFLLVKQAGFEPLGLVMGSSIYHIKPVFPRRNITAPTGAEVVDLTQALEHSRELAMTRMEEEAEALGADGIVGVRLDLNLHAWGSHVAEFVAVGTAVRRQGGGAPFRNKKNMPFTSDLTGQDFWTLLRAGYYPVGFVMGNCVYYVPKRAAGGWLSDKSINRECVEYTHGLYDARELAIERLQSEAEEIGAEGVVGVTVHEKQHSWGLPNPFGSFRGELIEFFVVGTAVVALPGAPPPPVPTLVIEANP
jgi:uncharacterized protein YbjQ (UPF0145 family)